MHGSDGQAHHKREKLASKTSLPCSLCGRMAGHHGRIVVEIDGKPMADEKVDVCPDCARDRYRVIELSKRLP